MNRTERRTESPKDQVDGRVAAQPQQAETELWQEMRQTSPEMAMQARIIRVLRPSANEPSDSYPKTSL